MLKKLKLTVSFLALVVGAQKIHAIDPTSALSSTRQDRLDYDKEAEQKEIESNKEDSKKGQAVKKKAEPLAISFGAAFMPEFSFILGKKSPEADVITQGSGAEKREISANKQWVHGAIGKANFDVTIKGKNTWDVSYGLTGRISLDSDLSPNGSSSPVINRSYAFVKGFFGDILVGSLMGVHAPMMVDGSLVNTGPGLYAGTWSNSFPLNPADFLIFNSTSFEPWQSFKASYMTPRFPIVDVQFGLSYIPDSRNFGGAQYKAYNDGTNFSKAPYFMQNALTYGVNFLKVIESMDLKLSASFTGIWGDTKNNRRPDWLGFVKDQTKDGGVIDDANYQKYILSSKFNTEDPEDAKAMQFGGLIACHGFEVGGGYITNGTSGLLASSKSEKENAGSLWNASIGYNVFDIAKVSGGYFSSSRALGMDDEKTLKTSDFFAVSAGFEVYPFRKEGGLTVYFEYNYVDAKKNKFVSEQNKEKASGEKAYSGHILQLGMGVNL